MSRILFAALVAIALMLAAGSAASAPRARKDCSWGASSTTAWAVGDRGTVLATTNGGKTWIAQTSGTTQFLSGIAAASTTTGVICCDSL